MAIFCDARMLTSKFLPSLSGHSFCFGGWGGMVDIGGIIDFVDVAMVVGQEVLLGLVVGVTRVSEPWVEMQLAPFCRDVS